MLYGCKKRDIWERHITHNKSIQLSYVLDVKWRDKISNAAITEGGMKRVGGRERGESEKGRCLTYTVARRCIPLLDIYFACHRFAYTPTPHKHYIYCNCKTYHIINRYYNPIVRRYNANMLVSTSIF